MCRTQTVYCPPKRGKSSFLLGEQSFLCEGDDIKIIRPEFLDAAIYHSRGACLALRDTDTQWKALNNLAFFLALQANPANGYYARSLAADLLMEYGRRERHPEILNTYGCVVGAYSTYFEQPAAEIANAIRLLRSLVDDNRVYEADKQKARRHLKVLTGLCTSGNPSVGLGG
jgi:hypothetical protein